MTKMRAKILPPLGALFQKEKGFWLASSFALALNVVLPGYTQSPSDQTDARVTSTDGDVTVFFHDQGDQGVPAVNDMPLGPGDKIRTGIDSRAEIGLDGDSIIEMDSSSEFIVDSLAPDASAFSLNFGSILAKIKSLVATGGQMHVRTPTAVTSVRGTEFGVDAVNDGPSHVAVFDEGHVSVTGPSGEGEVMLAPNQETAVARGARPEVAHPLQRFLQRRTRMQLLRRRIAVVRSNWRRLSPQQRQKLRRRIFRRRQRLIRSLRERRGRRQENGNGRRRE